jgi:DNA-directed RNA polymerase specialized sigma24 family protein
VRMVLRAKTRFPRSMLSANWFLQALIVEIVASPTRKDGKIPGSTPSLANEGLAGRGSNMTDVEPITLWLRQLEAGDCAAERKLWRRYYDELVRLARRRLGTTPRRVFDEEDIALSVLHCLYEGAVRGRFTSLVNRRELWQLLATITGRKIVDRQRLLTKQRRGKGRVRGDSVLRNAESPAAQVGFDWFASDTPTPEVLAIAAEEYRRLMALLADEQLRQIAEWKLEGIRNKKIAEQLGLTCRSVERKLQRIRRSWAREIES